MQWKRAEKTVACEWGISGKFIREDMSKGSELERTIQNDSCSALVGQSLGVDV